MNRKEKRGSGKIRKIPMIFAGIFLISGTALLFYPRLTDYLYREAVQEEKEAFEEMTGENAEPEEGGGRSFEALYQELARRNAELFEEKQQNLTDAFSYEQTGIRLSDYGMESDIFGFLYIPALEVELPILFGANTENLSRGAAHLTETSYPIGGANTNCVFAAHRGYAKTAMFRHIERLSPGDEIYIRNPWETLVYTVTDTEIIAPSEIEKILIREGRDMVTLISCHPYRENYQRYVVYCDRAR